MTTEAPVQKIRLRQSNLKSLLDRASGAVGRLTPYFLLEFFLVRITCTAADNTIRLVSEIGLHDGEEVLCGGTACVSAVKLSALVSALPDTFIDLTVRDNKLLVECSDYSGTLPCVDADTCFPAFTWPARDADFACAGDLLPSVYNACRHALGKDQLKYQLTGLYLSAAGEKLTAVAMDGHRLSLAGKSDLPLGADIFTPGVILPPRALGELKKITAGHLHIWKGENSLILSAPGISLVTQLLDGDYPDYRRVIPTDHPGCCVVNAAELAAIVERVNILSEADSVTLDIQAGSDSGDIRVSAENEAGEASDLVAAEVQGEAVQIRVKPAYLVEALRSLGRDSADVLIKYGSSTQPLVLIPCDHSGWDERLEIIMPRSR